MVSFIKMTTMVALFIHFDKLTIAAFLNVGHLKMCGTSTEEVDTSSGEQGRETLLYNITV